VTVPRIDARPASAPARSVAVLHLPDHTGPSISLEAELGWLAAEGSLELVTPGPGRVAEAFGGASGHTELRYSALTLPRGPLAALRTARELAREVGTFRSHFRAIRPELAVIVTAMLPSALVAARREGIPTVLYVGELLIGPSAPGGARGLAGRMLIGRSGALADAIIACSDTVARQFGRRRAKVITIYPPIRDSYADGDGEAYRRRHALARGEPLIATVGSLTEGRGQDVLVRALPEIRRSIPRARCVIAGEPFPRRQDIEFSDRLRGLVSRLGLEPMVVFAGFEDRVADLYAAADVVVNPARFPEPFGRVAPEALVAGRPVVASDVGAVSEVLRDGETGLLVPAGEPEPLAAAVLRVLRDPSLAAELARCGREDALARFSAARGLERFKSVVAGTAPARGWARR
jgi:glycosyltransferase involved in cell wall biosynthesis